MGLSRLCCVTAHSFPVCTQITVVKVLLVRFFLMFNDDVIRLSHKFRSLPETCD